MQSDKPQDADWQIDQKNKSDPIVPTWLGHDRGEQKETHIVHDKNDGQAVGRDLPQEPAERQATASQHAAETGGRRNVHHDGRHQAEQAEDERIPYETPGQHVDREVSLHHWQYSTDVVRILSGLAGDIALDSLTKPTPMVIQRPGATVTKRLGNCHSVRNTS
ncbi:MAG: hypothetical protein M5U35_04315 [Roseovarius sp.]|nr:hypothetical protein [Roseovarius sp.]